MSGLHQLIALSLRPAHLEGSAPDVSTALVRAIHSIYSTERLFKVTVVEKFKSAGL
jgi:hypothetical protein